LESYDIYRDIAERTNGDIYIGVVGPVRTGKSTFIKRFMDLMVLPNIENSYSKERARDELPQSAAGRTIMTTEPKFVPNESISISMDGNVRFKVRLIDCVGYLVDGATGHLDGDNPRMVNTPWSDSKIPFAAAAEIGTKKVINDHSTIGILITTDGSVTDLERNAYIEAEARVVNELKAINKPFVIVLNSAHPYAAETEALRDSLAEKYDIPVVACNCAQIKADDINGIMEKALFEFPVKEIRINLPKWIETLKHEHWLKRSLIDTAKEVSSVVHKLKNVKENLALFEKSEFVKKSFIESVSLGEGSCCLDISLVDELFYRVLSETTGMEISGEHQLISTINVLSDAKREYDKVRSALEDVRHRGYGVVTPALDEMKLEEPQLVKHGVKYGVRIKASAPSIHLIRADIETEVSPIVGTEKQSEELMRYLSDEMQRDPQKVWELNMFGKSMSDLVKEGIQGKLYRMPEDAQMKLQEALQKIINEGSGGLICIIL
jgi:stage IV sporulation protein A